MAESYGGDYVAEHCYPGAHCSYYSAAGDSWEIKPVFKQPACAGPDKLALGQTWWVWMKHERSLRQHKITHLTQRVIAISYQGPITDALSEDLQRLPITYPLDAALQYGRICFVEEIQTPKD